MSLVLKPAFLKAQDINGYSEVAYKAKEAFHREGRAFLKSLALTLGLQPDSYEIRSNKAGPAVSGEVTLHHHRIYVQVSESCLFRGASVMYRSCKGPKDYSGGTNHFTRVANLADETTQRNFIKYCGDLLQREVA